MPCSRVEMYQNFGQMCVRFEVLTAVVMKNSVFGDMTPCSPLKVNRRFGGPPGFTLVAFLLFSTLKMEATCSSEMLIDFQRTARNSIPEDRNLQLYVSTIDNFFNTSRPQFILNIVTRYIDDRRVLD
jgi:hypothetical protein